jgi:hypothetical protein
MKIIMMIRIMMNIMIMRARYAADPLLVQPYCYNIIRYTTFDITSLGFGWGY